MRFETQELLKAHAAKLGVSTSKIIGDLIRKYVINDADIVPIVLKIPTNITKEESSLRTWLERKIDVIVKHLCQQKTN